MTNYKVDIVKQIFESLNDSENFIKTLKNQIYETTKDWFETFREDKKELFNDMKMSLEDLKVEFDKMGDLLSLNIIINGKIETNLEIIKNTFAIYVVMKSVRYILEKYYEEKNIFETELESIYDSFTNYNHDEIYERMKNDEIN